LEVDTHIPGTYVHSAAEREKVMNDAEKAAKESMRALMVFTNRLRSDYGKEPPTIEVTNCHHPLYCKQALFY
jgi:hypothetical protein